MKTNASNNDKSRAFGRSRTGRLKSISEPSNQAVASKSVSSKRVREFKTALPFTRWWRGE
jgi:hypothetical protein